MSSVAGQSLAIGNLGVGNKEQKPLNFATTEKLQMFVERYLELSSELKYRKGEGNAHQTLGEIMAQKGDYEQGTRNFYRAMKIAEELGDAERKEEAQVSFGVANANLKWQKYRGDIMTKVKNDDSVRLGRVTVDELEEEEDEEEEGLE